MLNTIELYTNMIDFVLCLFYHQLLLCKYLTISKAEGQRNKEWEINLLSDGLLPKFHYFSENSFYNFNLFLEDLFILGPSKIA